MNQYDLLSDKYLKLSDWVFLFLQFCGNKNVPKADNYFFLRDFSFIIKLNSLPVCPFTEVFSCARRMR
jgi:hypothetical protein